MTPLDDLDLGEAVQIRFYRWHPIRGRWAGIAKLRGRWHLLLDMPLGITLPVATVDADGLRRVRCVERIPESQLRK